MTRSGSVDLVENGARVDVHIAVADLPGTMQVCAERSGADLYMLISRQLTQVGTAVAVADVVGKAFGLDVHIPPQT